MGPPTPTLQRSKVAILTRDTGSKLVGELGEQVIIGTVFGGPEDNDGASIVHWGERVRLRQPAKRAGRRAGELRLAPGLTFHLRHRLVAQNRVFSTWEETVHVQGALQGQ